jgi:hypothetical protein
MNNPKRAIKLARVSTERQAKLYSLDYQLEQEQAYCGELGLVVVAELNNDTIQSILLFSADFQERLEEVEKSLAGKRTVIDGLDVTVTALR